jgi:uncharacterized damage-inducible protein DinB
LEENHSLIDAIQHYLFYPLPLPQFNLMQLSRACNAILNQLIDLVSQLKDDDFTKPSVTLSHSTIGQHLRHTVEFFICLEQGYTTGVVNYDNRTHDKLIETDRFLALNALYRIQEFISSIQIDQPLQLEVGYHPNNEESIVIETNFWRELTYNIEHAVHHMAIMKIGIRETAPYVSLPSDFGVAVSTLRYKNQQTMVRSNH